MQAMKQKIIISSTELKKRAITIIEALPLDVIHSVEIKEHKRNRSAEQNSLLWKWMTIIGAELGESKEAVHERYKNQFLVNIYERDDPEYSAMIQALRDVWRHGLHAEAAGLRKKIVALTSTTGATVKQMTEYLENIEHDAASLAIKLPFPEDNQ
jgi:hypothetical protein